MSLKPAQEGKQYYQSGEFAKALPLLQGAYAKGDAEAAYNLSMMYMQGLGVAADSNEAMKLLFYAAVRGWPQAQSNAGVAYASGIGVEQSWTQAVKWWQRAAKAGMPDAQYNLGRALLEGSGVKQDFKTAKQWLGKASEQDVALAHYFLGSMYSRGLGVGKDHAAAFKLYERAAEHGVDLAWSMMGLHYQMGMGVQQNLDAAQTCFEKSVALGNNYATVYLRELLVCKQLIPLTQEMSAGDLSVLEAIAKKGQSSAALTSPGSDNYRLWSELADLGWMQKGDAPEGVCAFSVTEKGQLGLDRFVAMLNASRKDGQKRGSP